MFFCFNNGAGVGQDGGLGLESGFAKQYRFTQFISRSLRGITGEIEGKVRPPKWKRQTASGTFGP